MPKFETGNKRSVIMRAMHYAIQDRESMIDSLTPQCCEVNEQDRKYIEECKALIRDFQKVLGSK